MADPTTNPFSGTTPSPSFNPWANATDEKNRVSVSEGNPFGIFVNAWRDIKDIGTGLWKLGGSIVHDTATGIGDLADLNPGEGDYVLDDMYNAVFGKGPFEQTGSVLLNDYQARYGSQGIIGGNLNPLYENPLSFISDALTVATLGGAGAAKGAKWAGDLGLASKTTEAGAALGEAGVAAEAAAAAGDAASVASGVSNVATAGQTVTNISRLQRIMKAIEGTAQRIYNPATGKVEVVAQSLNPVRRLLYQNRYLGLTTHSTPWLEARAAKMARLAEEGGSAAVRYAHRAEQYRTLAEKAVAAGATKAYRAGFAASRARRWVDLTVGFASGKSSTITDNVVNSFEANLGDIPSGAIPDEQLVEAFQGVNTDLTSDNIVAPAGRGVRRAEVFDEAGPATVSRGDVSWMNNPPQPSGELALRRLDDGTYEFSAWHGTLRDELPFESPDAKPFSAGGLHVGSQDVARSRLLQRMLVKPNNWREVIDNGLVPVTGRGRLLETSTGSLLRVSDDGAHNIARVRAGDLLAIYVEDDGFVSAIRNEAGIARFEGRPGRILFQKDLQQLDGVLYRNGVEGGGMAVGPDSLVVFEDQVRAGAVRRASVVEPRLAAVGTPFRAAYENAVTTAQRNINELTPKLRKAFGNDAKVIAGKVKGEAATRSKAELIGGTWRNVDDIQRWRIVAEDAWDPTKAQNIIDRVESTTGGKVMKVENSINNPMPGGERELRVVVELPDGSPAEFQILTPSAAKVVDATQNLRNIISTLALLERRGVLVGDALLRLRKAERISQHLWEGVTDELRTLRGGPAAAEVRARINRFRVDIFANTTDPLLGRGLDVHSVFDNAYKPLRYQHGAEFSAEALNGKGDLLGGPSPLVLDDALAQAGEMAPVYYPLMDAARLPARGDFLRKGGVVGTKLSDQNLQRNTGRLLSAANFSTDARRVWRIRAAQSARMQEHMDILFDTVEKYGMPLKKGEEAPPGWELFAPALVKKLQGQHNMLLDELANDPTGRGLRDLIEAMTVRHAEDMRKLIDSGGDMQVFAIPGYVAKRMRAHAAVKPFGETFDILFGTPTKMWKAMTLAGRPAWMVNNLFSNIIFLKLQGGRMVDVLKQLDRGYLKRMREAIGEEALQRVEGGLYSSHATTPRRFDIETVIGAVGDTMQRRVAQSRPGNLIAKATDWIQSINGGMEDAFRRASYLTSAEKAMERAGILGTAKSFWHSKDRLEAAFRAGLDEKTWVEAVDGMNKYMNDYNSMTPFGRNVLRPYVVPFYAFYKHAAKLLLTMPFEHPAKARLFALLQEADKERMRTEGLDPNNLPGWMTSDYLFMGRGEAGDYRFMSGGGLNPFNAVIDAPLNTIHPAWKVLYEQGTGRSTFTGRPFTDPNVVSGGFGSDKQFRVNPNTGEVEPVEQVAPGIIEHLLQQIPQYEMLKDALAGGITYDTTTLLDVIRGEGPVLDPKTGEPVSPRNMLMQLARLFGYSATSQDAAKMQADMLAAKTAAMQAWLARNGQATTSTTSGTTNPYA